LPALQSTKPDLAPTLKEESRAASGGRRGASLRNGLVTAQIAISLVLLIGSGLFVRSLISAQSVDPGFSAPGAGIIGLEMACVYSALGIEVSIVELMDTLMPGTDQDLLRPFLKIVKPRREALGEAPSDGDGEITATTHLNIADHKIATTEFAGALRHLGAARSLDPGKTTARKIDEAETRIRAVLEEEGILLKAIPQLNLSPSDIPKLDLSPEEGFVMSRIDGSYDIESILKISPMPVLDARIVVRKLVLDGHINLERPED